MKLTKSELTNLIKSYVNEALSEHRKVNEDESNQNVKMVNLLELAAKYLPNYLIVRLDLYDPAGEEHTVDLQLPFWTEFFTEEDRPEGELLSDIYAALTYQASFPSSKLFRVCMNRNAEWFPKDLAVQIDWVRLYDSLCDHARIEIADLDIAEDAPFPFIVDPESDDEEHPTYIVDPCSELTDAVKQETERILRAAPDPFDPVELSPSLLDE